MPVERRKASSLTEYLSDPGGFDAPLVYNADDAAEQSYRLYEESGREGATFSLYFGNLLDQPLFAVGLLPDCFPLPEPGRKIEPRDLRAFVRGNQELLSHPAHSIGLWYDATGDQVFMDVSLILADQEEAIALGIQHDQKPIFDLQTGEVLLLEGTGKPIG